MCGSAPPPSPGTFLTTGSIHSLLLKVSHFTGTVPYGGVVTRRSSLRGRG